MNVVANTTYALMLLRSWAIDQIDSMPLRAVLRATGHIDSWGAYYEWQARVVEVLLVAAPKVGDGTRLLCPLCHQRTTRHESGGWTPDRFAPKHLEPGLCPVWLGVVAPIKTELWVNCKQTEGEWRREVEVAAEGRRRQRAREKRGGGIASAMPAPDDND